MWFWSSVCSAWDSLFEFCAFSAKIWAHQNANFPQQTGDSWYNSLEIAPTSPNYVRALTDSLKAPYPTTLACLIPPSLFSWWLLRCLHLRCGYLISLLLASAYVLLLIYSIFCVCLYDAIRPLGCDFMLIKSSQREKISQWGDEWFKSSTIISSQSVLSTWIRFTATMEIGTFHLWGAIELSILDQFWQMRCQNYHD